jgi:hypothetical protein
MSAVLEFNGMLQGFFKPFVAQADQLGQFPQQVGLHPLEVETGFSFKVDWL